MAIQRPSLQKTLIQMDLNRFYDKPVTRISVALIMSLLCIGFFALAAIRPTLETMAQLLKQIDEKKALDVKLTQKISALSSAQRQLNDKENLFPLISLAVPNSAEFNDLVVVMEKLATDHQVAFGAAQIEKVPLEDPVGKVGSSTKLVSYPITLSFTGSYDNLIALMKEMSNLKRVIVIDRFDITPNTSDQASNLVLTLAIRAFSFHQVGTKTLAPTGSGI
jgi:Tfp pilus assembly protein PilO